MRSAVTFFIRQNTLFMKRTLPLLCGLLLLLLAVVPACAVKPSFPDPPRYNRLPADEIPIVATYAFYPPFITEQQFEWVKEAGFNVLNKMLHVEEMDSCLKLAERYGLYFTVAPWSIMNLSKIPSVVERYKGNPWIWGYRIADEPNASAFPKLRAVVDEIESLDPGQNVFINLYPAVGKDLLGARNYKTYLEEYVRVVNPPFISFDIYPVRRRGNGSVYVDYGCYATYEDIARVARESNRPFWSYVLSNSHAFYPTPEEAYIRFQVFTALGYGAQGIAYFTYLSPDFDKGKGEFTDSPIDAEGNRTATWYMVRNVNREVLQLSPVFLGAVTVEVSHTGPRIPKGTKRFRKAPAPFIGIESFGEGLMVSHFRNGSREYLMLVNRDVNEPQRVRLNVSRSVTRLYGDGKERPDTTGVISIERGGYALFRL